MGSKKFIMVALLVAALVLCQAHLSLGIRKLSNKEMKMASMGVDVDMLLGALPKGPTPPSAPSERGNPAPFSTDGDRILVSAPSPGNGHR